MDIYVISIFRNIKYQLWKIHFNYLIMIQIPKYLIIVYHRIQTTCEEKKKQFDELLKPGDIIYTEHIGNNK